MRGRNAARASGRETDGFYKQLKGPTSSIWVGRPQGEDMGGTQGGSTLSKMSCSRINVVNFPLRVGVSNVFLIFIIYFFLSASQFFLQIAFSVVALSPRLGR